MAWWRAGAIGKSLQGMAAWTPLLGLAASAGDATAQGQPRYLAPNFAQGRRPPRKRRGARRRAVGGGQFVDSGKRTKLALVIGNSAYRNLRDGAPTAIRDAHLVASALKQRGFAVDEHFNLDRKGLLGALAGFGKKVGEAGNGRIAVVYYVGLGAEIAGTGVLAPSDAKLARDSVVDAEVVGLHDVLRALSRTSHGVTMMFIDMPRNNPRDLRLRRRTRLVLPPGAMLVHATSPGSPLRPTGSGNSAFAAALNEAILTEGLKPPQFLRLIRNRVMGMTRGRQVPREEVNGPLRFGGDRFEFRFGALR